MNPALSAHWPLVHQLNAVATHLKGRFVGKDDIIDLLILCLVGRENLFLLGPPGTAKSALVRALAERVQGRSFEYLLTRFTEPNELFGPFDIRRLREGELVTNTAGMLPEADVVFLDELLHANSAILNSLLQVLNERVFRRGREHRPLPTLLLVGASNQLPEDEALQALFDRFLVRAHCDYVAADELSAVLAAGWQLEQASAEAAPSIEAEAVRQLQAALPLVDLTAVRPAYAALVRQLRQAGLALTDRRAVKLQRLLAASALLCERDAAQPSDLWVLRYCWDSHEQREVVAGIVDAVVLADQQPGAHPRAVARALPDPDALLREAADLATRWDDPATLPAERPALRDQLQQLHGRTQWLPDATQRQYVQQQLDALWHKVLHAA